VELQLLFSKDILVAFNLYTKHSYHLLNSMWNYSLCDGEELMKNLTRGSNTRGTNKGGISLKE
jgi:hypothetical protein